MPIPFQKSHSDLNQRTRAPHRDNWSRSKSNNALTARSVNANVGNASLGPVSEVTDNKLRQFTFEQPHEPEPGNEIQNQNNESDGTDGTIDIDGEAEQTVEKTSSLAATPSNRPSWTELLTAAEQKSDKKEPSLPALDQVMWGSVVDSSTKPNVSPAWPRQHGRKRARSSSPVSSPAQTPTVKIKKLALNSASPYADPTSELWGRLTNASASFTGAGASPCTRKSGNSVLAHAMVSSSPRPSKLVQGLNGGGGGSASRARSSAGLRRAVSCTSNWPKRRKMDSFAAQPNSGTPESPSQPSTKTCMMSEILESVNDELKDQSDKSDKSVSMNPDPPSSPSPQKKRYQPLSVPVSAPMLPPPPPPLAAAPPSSSDYGDDDFDDDTLLALNATMISVEDPTVVASSLAPGKVEAETESVDDEFGDLDDDFFAEAEGLLAEQIGPKKVTGSTEEKKVPVEVAVKVDVDDEDDDDDDDDLYGDDDFGDDFDFNAIELAATQASTPKPNSSRIIQRYLIKEVVDGGDEKVSTRRVKKSLKSLKSQRRVLIVEIEKDKKVSRAIHLRDDWMDTPANVGDYVHVISTFESNGRCVIDNAQHIIILHPDQLISSTVVADSFSCTRRAVLQDRVKTTSPPSAPLVYGTILHEIFQEALTQNKWSREFLDSVIQTTTQKHVEDLYAIKATMGDARDHLRSKMGEVRSWANTFISARPKPSAVVSGRNGDKASMCVNKLLDVEEHVWSPMYGLKGNIDATVQVIMNDGKSERTLTVPFEVKTGKSVNTTHQTQTVLYNLLLSNRYDIEVAYGILYYMETSQTMRIPAIRHELRHMIMQRNRLACHLRDRNVELPEMKRSQMCGNCYAKVPCFIYHRLADNGDSETSGMKSKFDEVVRHLTPLHQEFFLRWESLLTKEEKETQKLKRELWTMMGAEREKLGRCLSTVIIEEDSAFEEKNSSKINRYRYTFVKETPTEKFSFLDSQLIVGEPIVVSDEEGHFALALGFVTSVKKKSISVAVDRRLHNARVRQPGFDEHNNQVFAGIMEVKNTMSQQKLVADAPVRFRLDKDEFNNGMATVRNNIVEIMDSAPARQHIRSLVVDLLPPTFKDVPTQYTLADNGSLNGDQKRAIEKVMSARDYALVLGMPGTGKTTTIAHIIRALAAQGKSILLTSYTHTAVDNILLKLKDDRIPILRVGAPAKVHLGVRDFVTLAGQGMESFEEIHEAWHGSPIVATTCLGVNHPVFHERTFDYCIVDEASQITLPICLGPIRFAKRFVLVGDHNQLPPLVQNEEARKGGLDVSLFKLLSDTHPSSVVNLEHQYRMCEDIMTLSNTLIYNGRLKCGTESLKGNKLHIPDMGALRQHHFGGYGGGSALSMWVPKISQRTVPELACRGDGGKGLGEGCWLRDLLDPEVRACFVNTDPLGPVAREESKGNRTVNPAEATIVTQLVSALLSVGVPASEIGVMTHYRSQLSLLKHGLVRALGGAGGVGGEVEMHTADRFQGRDKEVIVLSLVRSNEAGNIGDLLRDWRRINVAFTRAKTKLLVIGSSGTLMGMGKEMVEGAEVEMVARFVGLMEEKGWVYDLGSTALGCHVFEEARSTAGTSSVVGSGVVRVKREGGSQVPVAQHQVDRLPPQPAQPGKRPKKGALYMNMDIGSGSGNGAAGVGAGKENHRDQGGQGTERGPKKGTARIGEKVLLRGKPILRDILNDMAGGRY